MFKMLKPIFKTLYLAGLVVILYTASGYCQDHMVIKPVAYVDDKVITNYDVVRRAELIQQMSGADDTNHEVVATIRQEALKNLIDTIILNLEAKKSGIKIAESDVKAMLEALAENNGMTYGDFLENLRQANIDLEELYSQLCSQLLYKELVVGQIDDKVFITNAEKTEGTPFAMQMIKNAEQSQKDMVSSTNPYKRQFTAKSKASLSEIVLTNEDNIAEIQTKLKDHKNFSEVAKQFSENTTSASNGGEIGWLNVNELDHAYIDAILHTKIGNTSKPFKLKDKIVIIKLLGLEEVATIPENGGQTKESVDSLLLKIYQNNEIGALTNKMRKDHLIRVL